MTFERKDTLWIDPNYKMTKPEELIPNDTTPKPCTMPEKTPAMERYDAGLLGGGFPDYSDWWLGYIRHELDRAHDFYLQQYEALRADLVEKMEGEKNANPSRK